MQYSKLLKIMTFVVSYFSPIATIIHVMFIFILIDFVSGIWAAKKEKMPIQSIKMRRTVTKMIWYMIAVIMAHMMENTFGLQWAHMAQITGGFICMVEVKSVFENITKITNEPVFVRIYKVFEKKAEDISGVYTPDKDETKTTPPDGGSGVK